MVKYDWKKTLKKFLIVAGEVVVLGLISYFTGRAEFLYLIPVLEAARNIFKHT